uniref:Laminin G domain-containing protein n=1 Tax=Biomphalaria glabrata TaxID=6526 RepID=A0A2C9M7S9_BIOGL
MQPLALRFRYRRAPSPGAGNQREEILIRSRECSSGGLFALTEDGETLKVRLISKKGQIVVSSLPLLGLNDTDWRQVRVEYSKGELTMSVSTGRLTYTSFNKGGAHIQVGVCGWLVGDPADLVKNVGSYTGELQEVYLSRCFEYGQ